MDFTDWKNTAKFVVAGPDMPQHAEESGVEAAWVFADDSFIEIVRAGAGVLELLVTVGNECETYDVRDFNRAAEKLWDNHARDNQPENLVEALRQATYVNDLDIALRCVMSLISADLDGGLAGIMFSDIESADWAMMPIPERHERLQAWLKAEIAAFDFHDKY